MCLRGPSLPREELKQVITSEKAVNEEVISVAESSSRAEGEAVAAIIFSSPEISTFNMAPQLESPGRITPPHTLHHLHSRPGHVTGMSFVLLNHN